MLGDVLGLAHVFVVFLWCRGGVPVFRWCFGTEETFSLNQNGSPANTKLPNWRQGRCETLHLGLYAA